MGKRRVSDADKIVQYQASLHTWQVNWIKEHPDFLAHQFFRNKLTEYINQLTELEEAHETT